ncbi:uncharacterized protein LOC116019137 [Ipomoea triloba]|uniref:uncharacterized protein LOC116019137 n=1 Tax=Ipomoea triloba TaxID=35885 RepID=UPI00125CDEC6|nr:uncharacterized protein LOC116019137 [Ipomoea triloba]GMD51230.1 Zinc finger protein [Ipomoea batatas]GME16741.1 Zinc finger protein [Ipomoea batatas]
MAADVSSLFRTISGRDMNESGGGGKPTAPITRDLLGGCCSLDSKELDLDLQVPSGWEKRLDLKSGKVYLQRCNSTNSSASTMENKQQNNHPAGKLQDLNFPPSSKLQLNLFDEANLDLKLVPSSSSPPSSSSLHSVCTLEKVKSALERAEKESSSRKRSMSLSNSSSPLSNSLSSSIRDYCEIDQENTSASFAAGCPNCLLYVLISKNSPRCPRCNTVVQSPTLDKKPRIDLNISI